MSTDDNRSGGDLWVPYIEEALANRPVSRNIAKQVKIVLE